MRRFFEICYFALLHKNDRNWHDYSKKIISHFFQYKLKNGRFEEKTWHHLAARFNHYFLTLSYKTRFTLLGNVYTNGKRVEQKLPLPINSQSTIPSPYLIPFPNPKSLPDVRWISVKCPRNICRMSDRCLDYPQDVRRIFPRIQWITYSEDIRRSIRRTPCGHSGRHPADNLADIRQTIWQKSREKIIHPADIGRISIWRNMDFTLRFLKNHRKRILRRLVGVRVSSRFGGGEGRGGCQSEPRGW